MIDLIPVALLGFSLIIAGLVITQTWRPQT
jgi:hypothetical protein